MCVFVFVCLRATQALAGAGTWVRGGWGIVCVCEWMLSCGLPEPGLHVPAGWGGLGCTVFVWRWLCVHTHINTNTHTLAMLLIGRRQLLPTRKPMWKYSSFSGPQAATPHFTIYPHCNEHKCAVNSFPVQSVLFTNHIAAQRLTTFDCHYILIIFMEYCPCYNSQIH